MSLLIASLATAGCKATVDDYEGTTPNFDLQDYFDSNVTAWGIIQDFSGKVTRKFCVELQGTWQGRDGTLAEKFYFDDGEISYRNWQITRLPNNEYQGQAEDVIGIAKGKTNGFSLRWQYNLEIEIDGSKYQFSLDDWMYRIDKHHVFNLTKMKKFGITVADITIFFDNEKPHRQCKMREVT